jgi:hypothetical protein
MIKTSVTSSLKAERVPLTLLQKGSLHIASTTGSLANKSTRTTLPNFPASTSFGGGTVGSITGTGPWTATITGISNTDGLVVGAPLTATAGTGTLFGGSPTSVVVASIVSSTSITYTVTGGTTPTAGTVTSITTTNPIGGAVYAMPNEHNCIKIIPFLNEVNACRIRVTGWSQTDTGGVWVPHMLFLGTVADINASVASTAFPGYTGTSTNLYPVTTYTNKEPAWAVTNIPSHFTVVTGTTGTSSGGCIVLDTLGSSLIEIEFKTTTSSSICNAFVAPVSIY